MKKIFKVSLITVLPLSSSGCTKKVETKNLDEGQMQSICELATVRAYYHNVAKFTQENAWSFLWLSKDKHFWIEYDGTVDFGLDASKLQINVNNDIVTIKLPKVVANNPSIDGASLNEGSFIVDKNSVDIKAEDEQKAITQAQKEMFELAETDKDLLDLAQERAKTLLTEYVNNIGKLTGVNYQIKWEYITD